MALPDFEPARITAEEVNCLIHAYFQDSGLWPLRLHVRGYNSNLNMP